MLPDSARFIIVSFVILPITERGVFEASLVNADALLHTIKARNKEASFIRFPPFLMMVIKYCVR
jgi:hypothetical protein